MARGFASGTKCAFTRERVMVVYRDRKFMVLLFCECIIVLALVGRNRADIYQLDAGRAVWHYNGIAVAGA